jgi:hypothetical protein
VPVSTPLYTATYGAVYPGFTTWPYYGHVTRYYLDYIDLATQQTLAAAPGGSYAMMAVNSRPGLTIPPPDGEWAIGTVFMVVLRPHSRIAAANRKPLVRAIGAGPCGLAIVSGEEEALPVAHPQALLLPRVAEVPIPQSPVTYATPVILRPGAGPCGLATARKGA